MAVAAKEAAGPADKVASGALRLAVQVERADQFRARTQAAARASIARADT
jgi:hypothetical protein